MIAYQTASKKFRCENGVFVVLVCYSGSHRVYQKGIQKANIPSCRIRTSDLRILCTTTVLRSTN